MQNINSLFEYYNTSKWNNPFMYIPFILLGNHFVYLRNYDYCYKKPFTVYFNKTMMDTRQEKNIKILKKSIFLLPILGFYLYKTIKVKENHTVFNNSVTFTILNIGFPIVSSVTSLKLLRYISKGNLSFGKYNYFAFGFFVYSFSIYILEKKSLDKYILEYLS